MTGNRFEHPDENGFFRWDGGDVWVPDGDQYVIRSSAGKEVLVRSAVEDSAYFTVVETGEDTNDLPEFDDGRFGIKPAGPNDRICLLIMVPGATLQADIAALDAALSGSPKGTEVKP